MDAHKRSAKFFADAAGIFSGPVVTRVEALQTFYPAESYHQDFIAKNPRYPYVVFNDLPKIRNLEKEFPDLYRAGPHD